MTTYNDFASKDLKFQRDAYIFMTVSLVCGELRFPSREDASALAAGLEIDLYHMTNARRHTGGL